MPGKQTDSNLPGPEQLAPRIDFRRKSPFFFAEGLDEKVLGRILSAPGITERENALLTAIFDLCGTSESGVVSIEDICLRVGEVERSGRVYSVNGIYKRARRLVQKGVLKTVTVPRPKNQKSRPVQVYVLQAASPALPAQPEDNTGFDTLPTLQFDLFDESKLLAELWDHRLRIDDFWCGVIASVLPIQDSARLSVLETTVHIYGVDIPVTLSARPGSRIPTIRSMKTVIAILSVVEQIILHHQRQKPGEPVGNRFVVDLRHVLQLMKLPNKGGNRRTVVQHLREWEDTVFRFTDIHPVVRESLNERFGEETFGFKHHQLISQLCGVGVLRENQRIPTHIGFELPQDLVNRIAEAGIFNLFTVTPAIMDEDDPVAIAFHLYCRKTIGHKSRLIQIHLKTLWQRIGSTLSYRRFKTAFVRMLERKRAELLSDPEYSEIEGSFKQEGRVYPECTVLGYRVALVAPEKIAICIDIDDPYVGYRSRHKQLKQLDEREASAKHDLVFRKGRRKPKGD